MRQFTLYLMTAFLLAVSQISIAQNELTIINPQWGGWWGNDPGNIDEATFVVEPKGIYTQVQMELTFSHLWDDVGNDSLEIILDFTLPEGSIVHDSWLWVYDLPVQADILDVWSATLIYEDIVDRQTDPSILYRKESGYQLRVYPLTADETRKVKLTFLLPTRWTDETVLTELPTHILGTSYEPLTNYQLLIKADDTWQNFVFGEQTFTQIEDPDYGTVQAATIQINTLENCPSVSFDAPWTEGIFLETYTDGTDNFYQLAMQTAQFDITAPPRRIVFSFDHQAENSTINEIEFFESIKNIANSHLDEGDYFNIVYSHSSGVQLLYDEWQVFNDNALNMPPLFYNHSDPNTNLQTGIGFIESQGLGGEILFITNSDVLNEHFPANFVLDLLSELMTTDIPIHILDFQNTNINWSWIGNERFYGNDYFNSNLTRLTNGHYYRLYEQDCSIEALTEQVFQALKGVNGQFDLYTSLANGVCFQRYNMSYGGQSFYLNEPVLQLGKFQGEFPFELEYTSIMDGIVNSQAFIVEEADIITGENKLLRKMWTGHQITHLETLATNNDLVQDIIDISIEERVLSSYTAFLAVEPDAVPDENCFGCWEFNEDIIILTTEEPTDIPFKITASPNPFQHQVIINLTVPSDGFNDKSMIEVYDSMGKLVRTLSDFQQISEEEIQLTWNGKDNIGNELVAGVYFLVLKSNQSTINYKLIKI